MTNLLKMMKQAASLQKDMKRIQKDLASKTVESTAEGGKIRVVARGDMSLEGIHIDPSLVDEQAVAALEKGLLQGVNAASKEAKEVAGREMKELTSGMGLPDVL